MRAIDYWTNLGFMRNIFEAVFAPKTTVLAHCDLPCGVYDPAQARIEALSVKACMESMQRILMLISVHVLLQSKKSAHMQLKSTFGFFGQITLRPHTLRPTHSCTHSLTMRQSSQELLEQRELKMLQLQIH